MIYIMLTIVLDIHVQLKFKFLVWHNIKRILLLLLLFLQYIRKLKSPSHFKSLIYLAGSLIYLAGSYSFILFHILFVFFLLKCYLKVNHLKMRIFIYLTYGDVTLSKRPQCYYKVVVLLPTIASQFCVHHREPSSPHS